VSAKPAAAVVDAAARFIGPRVDKAGEHGREQIQAVSWTAIDVERRPHEAARCSPGALKPLVPRSSAERNLQLNTPERGAVIRHLVDDMVGFGPLTAARGRGISDILVDGPNRIYVERAGSWSPTESPSRRSRTA